MATATRTLYKDKPKGPGPCPKCAGETKLRYRKDGQPFYGCLKYASGKCDGTRRHESEVDFDAPSISSEERFVSETLEPTTLEDRLVLIQDTLDNILEMLEQKF